MSEDFPVAILVETVGTYSDTEPICQWADGTVFEPSYVSHRFAKLLKKNDLPHIRFHDLRHTFATNRVAQWYREGKDVQALLPVLSTYLGHCNLDSTAVYISFTNQLLDEAGKRFQSYVML